MDGDSENKAEGGRRNAKAKPQLCQRQISQGRREMPVKPIRRTAAVWFDFVCFATFVSKSFDSRPGHSQTVVARRVMRILAAVSPAGGQTKSHPVKPYIWVKPGLKLGALHIFGWCFRVPNLNPTLNLNRPNYTKEIKIRLDSYFQNFIKLSLTF